MRDLARDTSPIAVPPPSDDAALFRAVARSVQDAIIAADEESRIAFWSDSAARIFGWSAGEIVGRSLTELMPERFREAHRAGIERVRAGGGPHVIGGPPVELVGLRADGSEFPIELTLGRWSDERGSWFTGVVRDVSERERLNRVLHTQYEVAEALAVSQGLDEAIEGALGVIARGMRWRIGQLWLVGDERALTLQGVWCDDPVGLADFLAASRERTFERGVGLPGRVWAAGRAAWLEELGADDNFPRGKAALASGLRSGVAAPLMADDRTYGVVEFFSSEVVEHDSQTLSAVESVGRHLGQVLLRRRAEAVIADRDRQEAQAAELNDEIVQGLALAHYSLAEDRREEAAAAITQTLAAAREMVSDLLDGVEVEPGRLRRTRPARTVSD